MFVNAEIRVCWLVWRHLHGLDTSWCFPQWGKCIQGRVEVAIRGWLLRLNCPSWGEQGPLVEQDIYFFVCLFFKFLALTERTEWEWEWKKEGEEKNLGMVIWFASVRLGPRVNSKQSRFTSALWQTWYTHWNWGFD